MGVETGQITTVRIANQIYHVRSAGNSDYVRQLADYVSARMAEVSGQTHTVDSLKVAILAALNIADEYFSTKHKLKELEDNLAHRRAEILSMIEPYSQRPSP